MTAANGAELVCRTLEKAGVRYVFGLPGTQNLELFEALRRSSLRTVVPTHELAASFMATGFARMSGGPGLLVTIPGPGLTYALTGLAEARLDSVPLVHLTVAPPAFPGQAFQLQAIDQVALARPIVKQVIEVTEPARIAPAIRDSVCLAMSGEPGPVLVQLRSDLLGAPASSSPVREDRAPLGAPQVRSIAELMRTARRVLLLVGQGAGGCPDEVRKLAERTSALVISTTSGRGILPEDHALSLGFEFAGTRAEALNALVESADLVLALGCKFSHNGSRGFQLAIPESKLVHVDASSDVLGRNYPARITMQSDVRAFLLALLPELGLSAGWPEEARDSWRARGLADSWADAPEPRLAGVTAARFFEALRRVLPADASLVTDSGLHQMLARRYFRVLSPNGLIVPTNMQSMGFGLPAAIGAKLARPERRVVALLGDGGMLMSSPELSIAAKTGLDLGVMVFNDGAYGLIRRSQLSAWGREHGSTLTNPDFQTLAAAYGAHYVRIGPDAAGDLHRALALEGTTLVEVTASDTVAFHIARSKGLVKGILGLRRH